MSTSRPNAAKPLGRFPPCISLQAQVSFLCLFRASPRTQIDMNFEGEEGSVHTAKKTLVRLAALAGIFCSGMALAATVEVGTCKGGYAQYGTIQDAVNAAPAGSIVLVCPGNYPEQVTISKSLTLRGLEVGFASGAMILVPAGGVVANTASLVTGNPIAAQVLVQNTSDVDISDLTVDGSNNRITSCTPILIGIFYENASGTISHVAALNQALVSSQEGCQSGLAIFAQSGNGGSSDLQVKNTVVQGYQKNGITGNEPGTSMTITDNSVTGQGPTNGAAENGIQIGFGATGRILRNTAIDDIWAPDTIVDRGDAASGILVYASSNIIVHDNTVGNTQFGIALVTDSTVGVADGNHVARNRISATHVFDGIEVCSNSNTIHDNTISRADESGIHLDSSCTNPDGSGTGKGNRLRENAINSSCAGILVGSSTSGAANSIFDNDFFNVGNTILNGDQCSEAMAAPLAGVRANASLGITQGRLRASPTRP
jgi:hypothetical protein